MNLRPIGTAAVVVSALLASVLTSPGPVQALAAGPGPDTVTRAPARAPAPVADPDRTSTTPAGWGWHTNVSAATMTSFIRQGNRITDLEVNTASGTPTFSAAYVANSGSYQRGWWWYHGQTGAQVSQKLQANGARILDLEPYVVSGQVRYAVVMVKNSGDSGKAWGWYAGTTLAQIGQYASQNNMRLIDSDRYKIGTTTRYSAVFVKNTGVDAASWWHYYGVSPATVSSRLTSNSARLVNLERNADGTLDVIMTRGGFSGSWWWQQGRTAQQVTDFVNQVGGRIFHVDSRVVSGARRYDVIVLDNTDAETRRVRNLVSSKMSGSWGFYLKRVAGETVAGLNHGTKFEPASMIKIVHAVHALRDVQADNRTVAQSFPWRLHPDYDARYPSDSSYSPNVPGQPNDKDVCAYNSSGAPIGTTISDPLGSVILTQMLQWSDNRATDAIVDQYGMTALNATMATAGMTSSRLNHRINCPSASPVQPNQLTLVDAGKMYEGVERLTLLDNTRRTNLYQYLSSTTPADDDGTFEDMVESELSAAGLTATEKAQFKAALVVRFKPGGYTTWNGSQWVVNGTMGGTAFIPAKARGSSVMRPYVFGRFHSTPSSCSLAVLEAGNCTQVNNASTGVRQAYVEMMRTPVRSAAATW